MIKWEIARSGNRISKSSSPISLQSKYVVIIRNLYMKCFTHIYFRPNLYTFFVNIIKQPSQAARLKHKLSLNLEMPSYVIAWCVRIFYNSIVIFYNALSRTRRATPNWNRRWLSIKTFSEQQRYVNYWCICTYFISLSMLF